MCGCMFVHATMDHPMQQLVPQPPAKADAAISAGTQRCLRCGTPVAQDFTYCPGCGARQKATPCPACGQKVELGWGACEYCGFPFYRSRG